MLTLILAALLAQPAAAPADTPTPSVITQPDWLRRPSADDLAEFYPKDAARDGVSGRATISCQITAAGQLVDCSVLSEDPPGAGFGQAAVAMASKFEMRPMTRDGKPVAGGTVRIPINFSMAPTRPNLREAMICYGFAADALESGAETVSAWRGLAFWSGMVALNVMEENGKPSDFEARLGEARRSARQRRAVSTTPADRKACDEAMAKLTPGG